jgi:hypothetical protein
MPTRSRFAGAGEPHAGAGRSPVIESVAVRLRLASEIEMDTGIPALAIRINFLDLLREDHLQDESIQERP